MISNNQTRFKFRIALSCQRFKLSEVSTVNSNIFVRIIFSRKALKHICDVKNRDWGMMYLPSKWQSGFVIL